MSKYEKLYESVIDIINWAESQRFINEDAATTLIRNISETKQELDNNNE